MSDSNWSEEERNQKMVERKKNSAAMKKSSKPKRKFAQANNKIKTGGCKRKATVNEKLKADEDSSNDSSGSSSRKSTSSVENHLPKTSAALPSPTPVPSSKSQTSATPRVKRRPKPPPSGGNTVRRRSMRTLGESEKKLISQRNRDRDAEIRTAEFFFTEPDVRSETNKFIFMANLGLYPKAAEGSNVFPPQILQTYINQHLEDKTAARVERTSTLEMIREVEPDHPTDVVEILANMAQVELLRNQATTVQKCFECTSTKVEVTIASENVHQTEIVETDQNYISTEEIGNDVHINPSKDLKAAEDVTVAEDTENKVPSFQDTFQEDLVTVGIPNSVEPFTYPLEDLETRESIISINATAVSHPVGNVQTQEEILETLESRVNSELGQNVETVNTEGHISNIEYSEYIDPLVIEPAQTSEESLNYQEDERIQENSKHFMDSSINGDAISVTIQKNAEVAHTDAVEYVEDISPATGANETELDPPVDAESNKDDNGFPTPNVHTNIHTEPAQPKDLIVNNEVISSSAIENTEQPCCSNSLPKIVYCISILEATKNQKSTTPATENHKNEHKSPVGKEKTISAEKIISTPAKKSSKKSVPSATTYPASSVQKPRGIIIPKTMAEKSREFSRNTASKSMAEKSRELLQHCGLRISPSIKPVEEDAPKVGGSVSKIKTLRKESYKEKISEYLPNLNSTVEEKDDEGWQNFHTYMEIKLKDEGRKKTKVSAAEIQDAKEKLANLRRMWSTNF